MKKRITRKSYSRIIRMVFVVNAAFLIWAILWKCGAPFIGDGSQRAIQLIPFQGNTGWEMQLNVLLFVPFGFLLSALMARSPIRQILITAFASLLMEIVQYILAIGRSDTTDILLNTLGGIIGIGVYYLVAGISGRHWRTAIVVIGVLIIILELYMAVSFIMFGMVRLGFMMFRI